MKKKLTKPFFIQFIGILFILLPFLNIFQAYWIHNSEFPFFRLTTLLHYFPPYVSLILFFSAPFIGFGILKVKKWAYYGFFIYCSFLILNNFYLLLKFPGIFEVSSFIYSTLSTLGIVYFLNRDIRSPYLYDEDRGWRIGKRIDPKFSIKVKLNDEEIILKGIELSRAGCLIELPNNFDFEIGSSYLLEIQNKNNKFACHGEILRILDENKLGIKFASLLPKKVFDQLYSNSTD